CNEACVKDPNSDADGIMNNPMQRSFIEVVSPGSADKQGGSEVANNDTVLPKAAMKGVKSRYDNTLIGYFVGKSLAFSIVQNYVKNTLFKFHTKGGMDQVLERGPWLICNTPLILNKWSPNISLKPDEVSKVPVRVKLYNIPVVAYSEDGLSLIATQIGKSIMLDAFTSSMCVDSWGRISFARALIKIHANSELKKDVRMAILVDDVGTDYTSEVIRFKSMDIGFVSSSYTNKKDAGEEVNKADVAMVSCKEACVKDPNSDVDGIMNNPMQRSFIEVVSPGSADKQGGSKVANNDTVLPKAAMEGVKSRVFLFKFHTKGGMDQVLERGGGFYMDEDDLDCYDGYEAQGYDIP
nr:hypothetical protein [Tanacetum cinerariifolium]